MVQPGGYTKRKGGASSLHSRAARRATSPSVDTDRSLKTLRPPAQPTASPSVLAARRSGGGISRPKRVSVAERKRMRLRREHAANVALSVLERTSQRVEYSERQARVLRGRRRGWEDVNDRTATTLLATEQYHANKRARAIGFNLLPSASGDEMDKEEEQAGADADEAALTLDQLDMSTEGVISLANLAISAETAGSVAQEVEEL